VPPPRYLKLTPEGSVPFLLITAGGEPVVVTRKLNAPPNATVSAASLVKASMVPGVTVAGALAPESPAVVCAITVMW
jgi:hypothetical protein